MSKHYTFFKEAIFKFEESFDTDINEEGHKTCQESYDTHQDPAQHFYVDICLHACAKKVAVHVEDLR